jgi:predicted amidohydrolase
MRQVRLSAAILQFPILMDIDRNMAALEGLVSTLRPDTLAIAPEGALSGYLPSPDVVTQLDPAATAAAIARARDLADQHGVHLVAGACVLEAGAWRNRTYYFAPGASPLHYDKINLATSERGVFTPGEALPVFDVEIGGQTLRLGIQMCREIRYPEQWRVLAAKGAHIIAYVNNAIGSAKGDALWRAHVISRAAETQRFVIGANNAADDQTCPSIIVAPSGDVLAELRGAATERAVAELDLDQVTNWVLDQARTDVVQVTERR